MIERTVPGFSWTSAEVRPRNRDTVVVTIARRRVERRAANIHASVRDFPPERRQRTAGATIEAPARIRDGKIVHEHFVYNA